MFPRSNSVPSARSKGGPLGVRCQWPFDPSCPCQLCFESDCVGSVSACLTGLACPWIRINAWSSSQSGGGAYRLSLYAVSILYRCAEIVRLTASCRAGDGVGGLRSTNGGGPSRLIAHRYCTLVRGFRVYWVSGYRRDEVQVKGGWGGVGATGRRRRSRLDFRPKDGRSPRYCVDSGSRSRRSETR